MSQSIETSTTRSQEAACIPILLLGRGITLGRGETMELIHFQWCFYTILICYTFLNVYLSILNFFVFLSVTQLSSGQNMQLDIWGTRTTARNKQIYSSCRSEPSNNKLGHLDKEKNWLTTHPLTHRQSQIWRQARCLEILIKSRNYKNDNDNNKVITLKALGTNIAYQCVSFQSSSSLQFTFLRFHVGLLFSSLVKYGIGHVLNLFSLVSSPCML